MSGTAPVAVFDSGMGGLSVAREIRHQLPEESLVYLADSLRCPYGGKPIEEVRDRTLEIGRYLQGIGSKLLVVACNTASGAGLEALREHLTIPVVGMEPAIKPAVAASAGRRVGVMATEGTIASERFTRLLREHAEGVAVVAQPCPGLVELVEEGETEGEAVRKALLPFVTPMREQGVDVVVLGCTHYPFLRGEIAGLLGREVRIIDSAPAIARQVRRVLEESEDRASGPGGIRMLTTGDPRVVGRVISRLWGETVRPEAVVV